MFRAVCFFISTSEKGYFFSLNKQFLSHFPWTLLRHGWVPAMSVCPHTKKADHWSVEQNGAVKQLLFLRTLSSCSWTKAEQTRLLVAAISFFFSPPPAPKQLLSSEDFLQHETGSAAAWETGGGRELFLLSLPFLLPHERGAEALSSWILLHPLLYTTLIPNWDPWDAAK